MRNINVYATILALTIVLLIIRAYAVYILAPPVPDYTEILGDPDLYRIYYSHIGTLWASFAGFGVTFVCSILYLIKRDVKWDVIAASSAVIGVLFCTLGALVFGPIFAALAWGTPWWWEPKQNMALILWLAYVGYIALHASIAEPETRARISAVFGICAFPSVPLSYLVGSVLFVGTGMHPPRIMIDPRIWVAVITSFVAMLAVYGLLVKLMYDIEGLRERVFVTRGRG